MLFIDKKQNDKFVGNASAALIKDIPKVSVSNSFFYFNHNFMPENEDLRRNSIWFGTENVKTIVYPQ